MGWGSGAEVAEDMIKGIEALNLDDEQKVAVYAVMIKALENHDWDTEDDVTLASRCFDRALFLTDPRHFFNEEYVIKKKGKEWMQFIKTGK